jgi:two-component system NtrC family sensor kinase
MDFARPRAPKLIPLSLAQLLADVRTAWLQESGLPAARLRLDVPAAPAAARAEILADREQMQVVFRELLNNATDAVSANDGTIVLRWQPALRNDMVEVLVTDSGCGMPPAVLQRAFDPFFSHRRAGRGRGLGLPRVYRIIEAHGGRVWLESQPDEGTTVHVLLGSKPTFRTP